MAASGSAVAPYHSSATSLNASNAPNRLHDIYNYDTHQEAVNGRQDSPGYARPPSPGRLAQDLGIDEEIKIRKRRLPLPKLDEERLLSDKGLPKLRRLAQGKLKFKGKGHEFQDVQTMLNTYQLWLDDLFPKANFADGLIMIEKVGHKRRIKVMRSAWIHEGSSNGHEVEERIGDDDFVPHEAAHNAVESTARDTIGATVGGTLPATREEDLLDDALYDLPAQPDEYQVPTNGDANVSQEPQDDELDHLLAEDAAIGRNLPGQVRQRSQEIVEADFGNFDDDEEAMRGTW